LLGASVHNLVDPAKPEDGGHDRDDAREDGDAELPFVSRDENAG
jgi:hypothetical protein